MNQYAHAKTDQDGDVWVAKYGVYANDRPNAEIAVNDTLTQLEKNYEQAFGEVPSPSQMKQALEFVGLLFAEISHTGPTTLYAQAVARLSWIIQEDDPVQTAVNIRNLEAF